jgi:hypothetical protein
MKVAISTVALLFAVQVSTASAGTAEWLKEHNDRRLKYHKLLNGKEVVNLKWSTGLTEKAKEWAEGNVATCTNRQGSDDGYGRSAVMKKGSTMGLTEEWTLQNWENKKSQGYPSNGAFTQAIWRPTKYVGCHIATSTDPAKPCQSAVCYYAKPGNCAMAGAAGTTVAAKAAWRKKVFADDSGCTPNCPPELPNCDGDGTTSGTTPTRKPAKKA